MKRSLLIALAVAGLAGGLTRPQVRASESLRIASRPDPGRLPRRTSEVIVAFRSEPDVRLEWAAIRLAGGGWARKSAFGQRYLVGLDAGFTPAETLARFRTMPEVAYAEADGPVRAFFTPNDSLFSAQWHLKLIDAERTWSIQKGDPSVAVAVLDTGIAYEDFGPFRKAPDFEGTVFIGGFNALDGGAHANDDNFHGTHVASTIAEATNNGFGAAGLAFDTALVPVKVLDEDGNGSFFSVAEGIDYATDLSQDGRRPVKVINLSLGADDGFSQTVQRAVDRAVAAGIVVVAAAGNESRATVAFPASLANVIAVGAVDGRKQKAPYSNFGAALDVMAPGGDLDRDDDDDGRPDGVLQQTFDPDTAARFRRYDDFAFFFVEGTSQATPHVSAMAALLVKQGITDPAAVKAAIESTAEDLGAPGRDDTFGWGLIRPSAALTGLGFGR
jgi:serine protease